MHKELLVQRVMEILLRAGFDMSERCNVRPRSFDIAARRGRALLLLKMLSNIDGLTDYTSYEMRQLANCLTGSPLIIGEKTRDHPLEPGVVYFRHGIPAIDVETMNDYFVRGNPPLVYAAHGGLYVGLEGEMLREVRIKRSVSIGELASLLGVSRRTVSKYEEGEMDASVDIASRLEEIFDSPFVIPVGIFDNRQSAGKPAENRQCTDRGPIIKMLSTIGFNVFPTSQAPFDAVTVAPGEPSQKGTLLTGISEYSSSMVKRAKLMSSISEVAHTQSVVIVNGSKVECIEKTVIVGKDELESMETPAEFIGLIQEKKKVIQ